MEVGKNTVSAPSGKEQVFGCQGEAKSLLGVIGPVNGGIEPPSSVVPPEMVVGVSGVGPEGKRRTSGQCRSRGVMDLLHGRWINAPGEIFVPADTIGWHIDAGETRSARISHRGISSPVGRPAFYGRTFLMLRNFYHDTRSRPSGFCVIALAQYPCGLRTACLSTMFRPTSGMAWAPRDRDGEIFVLTLRAAFMMASRLRRASSISLVSRETRTRRAVLSESWTV